MGDSAATEAAAKDVSRARCKTKVESDSEPDL